MIGGFEFAIGRSLPLRVLKRQICSVQTNAVNFSIKFSLQRLANLVERELNAR